MIKKISFKKEIKSDILRELNSFSVVYQLLSRYVVVHYRAWLENSKIYYMITLYIRMEIMR